MAPLYGPEILILHQKRFEIIQNVSKKSRLMGEGTNLNGVSPWHLTNNCPTYFNAKRKKRDLAIYYLPNRYMKKKYLSNVKG